MPVQPDVPSRLLFGPFEVNPSAAELFKSGIRIRLSGQPFQILLVLLAHPGDLVTREQLRQGVWNEGTFVDFEHGLNAAVNKVRRALSDTAENPRYIETVPGQGYRFIGTMTPPRPVPVPVPDEPVIREVPAWRRSVGLRRYLASTAACLAVAFAVGWWLHKPQTDLPPWTLTRLTTDDWLSDSPALSPDGKLLAYSSHRGLIGLLAGSLSEVPHIEETNIRT